MNNLEQLSCALQSIYFQPPFTLIFTSAPAISAEVLVYTTVPIINFVKTLKITQMLNFRENNLRSCVVNPSPLGSYGPL